MIVHDDLASEARHKKCSKDQHATWGAKNLRIEKGLEKGLVCAICRFAKDKFDV